MRDTMLKENKILPEDFDLIRIIDDPDEAVRYIQRFVII